MIGVADAWQQLQQLFSLLPYWFPAGLLRSMALALANPRAAAFALAFGLAFAFALPLAFALALACPAACAAAARALATLGGIRLGCSPLHFLS